MVNVDYVIKWNELDYIIQSKQKDEHITKFVPIKSNNAVFISNNVKLERFFSIEFEKKTLEKYEPQKVNGLHISTKENKQLDPNKLYLVVKNNNPEYDNAFLAFSIIVFDALENTKDDYETLSSFEEVVDQNHDFFGFKRGLSKNEEQGLLAELLYLKEEISKRGEIAIKNWHGCEKNKRDFIFDECAVEIKSTLNQKQDIVHISNENQLDPMAVKKLYLKLYIFDENNTGIKVSSSLKEIYESIVMAEMKKLFEIKVSSRGINLHTYEGKYCFKLEKIKTYLIDDSFPKIIKTGIPTNIFDVEYKINLSEIVSINEEKYND